MAALGYPEDGGVSFKCGGSLVADNFILTAAHCLTREQPNVARLGQVNLMAAAGEDGQDIAIADIIMHPDYVPSRNYHDIALLRLASNVSMSENVYPACLRTSVVDVPNEAWVRWWRIRADYTNPICIFRLLVTGWGDTSVERRERSNVLLKTNLTAVDLPICNQTYAEQPSNRRLPNLLNQGQLCAYDPRAVNDACQV